LTGDAMSMARDEAGGAILSPAICSPRAMEYELVRSSEARLALLKDGPSATQALGAGEPPISPRSRSPRAPTPAVRRQPPARAARSSFPSSNATVV
jgi:hypothetical protein